MATRPYKDHSDNYIQKSRERLYGRTNRIKIPAQYSNGLDSLIANIAGDVENHNGDVESLRKIDTLDDSTPWLKQLNSLKFDYSQLYDFHSSQQNEEKAIHRIERKSQFIALIFRFLTTIMIGLAVMFVYWAAGKLEIVMPLMRIGM
jgi:hypothetical protein